jgi:hypothetical protein
MQLLEVQRVLGQDVKSIGQLVTAKPTPGTADPGGPIPTTEQVLAEFLHGKKSGRGRA